MAKKRTLFASFNYPSSSNASQSILEYGNTALVNLDVDEQDGSTHVHSARGQRRSKFHLISRQPSLPFLEPNNCSSIPDVDQIKYEMERKVSSDRKKVFSEAGNHIRNMIRDHPEILYGCTAKILQDEFSDSNSNFVMCDTHPWNDTKDIVKSGRHYQTCRFCRALGMSQQHMNSPSLLLPQKLHSGLSEIPTELLYDLVHESYEQKIADWYYNSLQGNNIVCIKFEKSVHGPSACLMCYPSGSNLDELNTGYLTEISSSYNESDMNAVLSPQLSYVPSQNFQLLGRLNQLDCCTFTPNQVMLGARTQYQCSFLAGKFDTQKNIVSLKPAGTVATGTQVMSIAVNPYIYGEAVVVMETGNAYLWSVGKSLQTILKPSAVYEMSDSWQQVVFGGHPRQIVLAHTSGVDLVDFRAGLQMEKSFLSLASSHFSSLERISAVQRVPENTHHYIVGTDQSVVILDDRFVQNPILKWRHHLQNPAQFLQIMNNVFPDCDDAVIVVSGSRCYESHCYQYCPCSIAEVQSSMTLSAEPHHILPPSSTSLPWKVSPYDEWPILCDNGSPVPPEVSKELSRPLIGLGTMLHSSTRGGFTVLQLSAGGNLFQQHFEVVPVTDRSSCSNQNFLDKTANVKFDMNIMELTKDNGKKCQDWVQTFMEQERKKQMCHNYDFGGNSKYVTIIDKTNTFLKVTDLPDAHPSCPVCCEFPVTLENQSSEIGADSTCERCGLDILVSVKLKQLQHDNKVVTNEALKIDLQMKNLLLISDLDKSRDPLSSCLLWNWNHDVVKPLEIGTPCDGSHSGDEKTPHSENDKHLSKLENNNIVSNDNEKLNKSCQLSQESSVSPVVKLLSSSSTSENLLVRDETENPAQFKENPQLQQIMPKRVFHNPNSPFEVEAFTTGGTKKLKKNRSACSMGF